MGLSLSRTQREKGQYFTPENIVQAIIGNIVYYLDDPRDNDTLSVLDPSAGEGIFCRTLIQILKNKFCSINIDALDIDPSALSRAKSLVINSVKDDRCSVVFHLKNFLTEFDTENQGTKYDLIISNPPHHAKYSPQEWDKIRKLRPKDVQENIPSESALYFVLKSINLLKDRGILSFILPKPFIYSNKWKIFRQLCLTQVRLLEVFDLANQFSGQLQEQVALTLQKISPSLEFRTGIWDPVNEKLAFISTVKTQNAIRFDNFLVGVTPSEQKLMEKLLKDHRRIEWTAFRGLSSRFRVKDVSTPLIEKVSLTHGFLFPERNYVNEAVPEIKFKRLKQPKIIGQRIIAYKTKPKFQLDLPIWVDSLGVYLTHETVINIIPPYSSSNDIYAYGALLQSKFINWWLQNAVYTKRFVTSKDLDKPYLNKLIIPRLDGDSNSDFRSKIKKMVEKSQLPNICLSAKKESNVDQFFVIGEIFKLYLNEGKELKQLLDEMVNQSIYNQKNHTSNPFKLMKQIDRFFRTRNVDDLSWLGKQIGIKVNKSYVEGIFGKYSRMEYVRSIIDEIVFNLYELSQNEKQIILEGE
ncbi:hypothetical protein CEE45_14180 [Candidatus Heimdallarchaeota archaeon B3_Heim]|nr:MAG: hypothetical protein CEE45_14180 [Candidatus Heimdallarchaeota archaeon B3_Heim]